MPSLRCATVEIAPERTDAAVVSKETVTCDASFSGSLGARRRERTTGEANAAFVKPEPRSRVRARANLLLCFGIGFAGEPPSGPWPTPSHSTDHSGVIH
jgi:hypothetical protein